MSQKQNKTKRAGAQVIKHLPNKALVQFQKGKKMLLEDLIQPFQVNSASVLMILLELLGIQPYCLPVIMDNLTLPLKLYCFCFLFHYIR
jgi:hypothetical protein